MVGRFKLDENLPRDAGAVFSDSGHDVETVLGEQLGGDVDSKVFDVSRAENRILVTLDLDFADIQLYPPSSHPGIWVLRPGSQNIQSILALLKSVLIMLETEPTMNRLWIVEHGRIRVHE